MRVEAGLVSGSYGKLFNVLSITGFLLKIPNSQNFIPYSNPLLLMRFVAGIFE